MAEHLGTEVEALTIRVPVCLQWRVGRKLIMTPEGVVAPASKPRRDETLVEALVRAHLESETPTGDGPCCRLPWDRLKTDGRTGAI